MPDDMALANKLELAQDILGRLAENPAEEDPERLAELLDEHEGDIAKAAVAYFRTKIRDWILEDFEAEAAKYEEVRHGVQVVSEGNLDGVIDAFGRAVEDHWEFGPRSFMMFVRQSMIGYFRESYEDGR